MMNVPQGEPGPRARGVWKLDGEGSATMSCPTCGGLAPLTDHEIRADGVVAPSLVCPNLVDGDPCTFHDHVKLVGWPEAVRQADEK